MFTYTLFSFYNWLIVGKLPIKTVPDIFNYF